MDKLSGADSSTGLGVTMLRVADCKWCSWHHVLHPNILPLVGGAMGSPTPGAFGEQLSQESSERKL